MRVLFVVPYIPCQLRVRPYGFVRHLSRRHDVRVLALGLGELPRETLTDLDALRREGIPVTIVQEPRYQPYARALRSALVPQRTPVPLQVAYAASPLMRAAVASELRTRSYDVIHVEHIRGLGSLPAQSRVPVVWDAVDCVSLLFEQGVRHGATSVVHLLGGMEARRLRDFERQQILQLRHVLVTSERDRQALLKVVGNHKSAPAPFATAEITVLPHGVDALHIKPHSVIRQPNTLIFSGKMDYHANIAGARLLAEKIMPLIWRERPDARLVIAGSNPPRAVRQFARDQHISVRGYVPDLRALLASACIAVCPLPYAVGIQNKVLEAMATGTPVVASASAAQGLQAVPGRDLVVAGTAEEFASAILSLFDNDDLRSSIATHGAAYIASHHNWDMILDHLTAVYERAVAAVNATTQETSIPQPEDTEQASSPAQAVMIGEYASGQAKV